MTEDDGTKDDSVESRNWRARDEAECQTACRKRQCVKSAGGEQSASMQSRHRRRGLLSLDDLLSGEQGTSCSIDGTCD